MKGKKLPWNVKSQGSNVTQRSSWNSIYVTFSFERGAKTSLLILSVAQLVRADYSLMMWIMWITFNVHVCCELFPPAC